MRELLLTVSAYGATKTNAHERDATMAMAVAEGRATRPDIKLGICGEHGGNPASVQFCFEVGLDYVSCSPYRVPIARLAAAHAALGASGPGGNA